MFARMLIFVIIVNMMKMRRDYIYDTTLGGIMCLSGVWFLI